MGDTTGIAWTDSTMNFWEGCTKVGPGCDHCYAETRDIRYHGGSHWGAGAPRRLMSEHTLNNPYRWQKKAEEFVLEHGHHQRVFCSSLADIFDNEVSDKWRQGAWLTMIQTPSLRWQLCTKRVSNIAKMVPAAWRTGTWPANVGVLITVVTKPEVRRDVPRLIGLKRDFDIPWIGLSLEPLIEDVADELNETPGIDEVDWLILGGESGSNARPYDLDWAERVIDLARALPSTSVFHKQLGDQPTKGGFPVEQWTDVPIDGKGDNPAAWPEGLRVREFPAALQ